MSFQCWVYWMLMLLIAAAAETSPEIFVKPGCQQKCGNVNVTVPYPFGIGDRSCALNDNFWLNCTTSASGDELLLFPNMWVTGISVPDGTITTSIYAAFDCYNQQGNLTSDFRQTISLGKSRPFTFSASQNKFVAIGCDTFSMVFNGDTTYGTSCLSLCDEPVDMAEKTSCAIGTGCCETSIARNLKSVIITSRSINNHRNVSNFNPCGYGFLVGINSFNASDWDLSRRGTPKSDVVVEWVAESTESCEAAKANESSYACGSNTECSYSDNGEGYRCLCKEGFRGNPYRPFGCQDIDECEYPEKYPCKGKCKNTVGNYTCECPLGMHGDGKIGCEGFRVTTIVAVVGASLVLLVCGLLFYMTCMRRRRDKIFRENGGMILKHQRVRLFTEAELAKATRNYHRDWFLGEGGFGSVYKGVLPDNTPIAVKKPKELAKTALNQECEHEIGIVSQVNHRNVVKLLGLCLETKMPLLVYEFISNGNLYQHIHDRRSKILKTWKNILRVATETALALDYLHSLANPPIIHGDVKSMNILLDENYTAKVSDFGASVLVAPGQHDDIATKIQGTLGYLDPEYLMTGILTEKSDVYSFGVVLVELLIGEKPNCSVRGGEKKNIIQYFISSLENNNGLEGIICFKVTTEAEMGEVKEFAELARGCLNPSGIRRPSMKDVAEELGRLRKQHGSLWVDDDDNNEESNQLLGRQFSRFGADVENGGMNKPDTMAVSSFSIEYPIADSI